MFQCIRTFFSLDPLSVMMLALVSFIGVCIGGYAFRYMKGDARYRQFFLYLSLLVVSIGIMSTADHLALFYAGWCISNLLLVRLMIHKSSWKAAYSSGLLALKNYFFGAVCIGVSFLFFYLVTGESSIKMVIHSQSKNHIPILALLLLLIGGMTQSAIWPFHRWLISSLNSPTPVSAIMHAGLVNGGGFLIARFGPLYLKNPLILNVIFIAGITTALIGTFWKLIQNDVKRMLACSTMGQMGFMLAQCGLGLFPSAIAHLITHGMFKAYLFLASNAVAQEKRYNLNYPPTIFIFSGALACGFLGSCCFSLVSGKSWLCLDTTLILMVIAFITASQCALSILSLKIRFRAFTALVATSVTSLIYGGSIYLITRFMQPMQLMQPQALNGFHIAAIALLAFLWMLMIFRKANHKLTFFKPWLIRGYVAHLNASQPHPTTVTTHRNQYTYL